MLSWLLSSLLVGLAAPGCDHEAETHYSSVAEPPTVRLVQPQVRDLVRGVGQPSFIEGYERSSVFPKPNAFIKKWNVDIGDKVKKGELLATLFVPQLVEAHGTKQAHGGARSGADHAGVQGGGGVQGRCPGGRGASRGNERGTRPL